MTLRYIYFKEMKVNSTTALTFKPLFIKQIADAHTEGAAILLPIITAIS